MHNSREQKECSFLCKKKKKKNREEIWPSRNSHKESVFRIHDVKSSSGLMNYDLHLFVWNGYDI